MSSKACTKIIKYAEQHGFVLIRHKKHIIMRRGHDVISISTSPSDKYGHANAMRDIDRLSRKNLTA